MIERAVANGALAARMRRGSPSGMTLPARVVPALSGLECSVMKPLSFDSMKQDAAR